MKHSSHAEHGVTSWEGSERDSWPGGLPDCDTLVLSLSVAVVKQDYDVQVYDEHISTSNTAVLRCHAPPYVAEDIMVTSWEADGVSLYPTSDILG